MLPVGALAALLLLNCCLRLATFVCLVHCFPGCFTCCHANCRDHRCLCLV